jgi:RNA polymerase sigma factor (sigma-70 family)
VLPEANFERTPGSCSNAGASSKSKHSTLCRASSLVSARNRSRGSLQKPFFVTPEPQRQTQCRMRKHADRLARAQALWDQFSPAVSRTLLSYERDASLRQDLTQEVFLAVLDSVERIAAANNPKAYLLRVAHNVASDHIARESKHSWVELDEALVDPGMDPAGDAQAASERERLVEAVRRLRLRYRQAIPPGNCWSVSSRCTSSG